MTCAVIAFTRRGALLARRLADGLGASLHVPPRFAAEADAQPYTSLEAWTAGAWSSADALVFVGACGIAVRAIAPHIKDKFTDPAVVSVDEAGSWAVPLLSGHVGGANDLARRVAALTRGRAAVSTATDVNGVFAVDQWAARQGCAIDGRAAARHISAALLAGGTVGFRSDFPTEGPLPMGVTGGPAPLGFAVTLDPGSAPFPETLRVIPKILRLGLGCRRGASEEAIAAAVDRVLTERRLSPRAVSGVYTIDLKRDEPGLLAFCRSRAWPLTCYTAEELSAVEGDFTPSPFVHSVTGVDNVCERAAALAGGALLVRKQALNGVTAALAAVPFTVQFPGAAASKGAP